jgi:hypothetical protein
MNSCSPVLVGFGGGVIGGAVRVFRWDGESWSVPENSLSGAARLG